MPVFLSFMRFVALKTSHIPPVVAITTQKTANTSAQKEGGMWSFTDPFWTSVFRWATIAALVFGALTVVSAFISAWVGYEITDATQKEADQRIADARVRSDEANATAARANERAALLEREAAELTARNLNLERQIAPRRLMPAQIDSLVAVLRRHGQSITISSYALDVESAAFGEQLIRAFSAARLPFADRRMSISALGTLMAGIAVSGTDAGLVDELVATLASFGLAVGRQEPPPVSGITLGNPHEDAPAKIFIGTKPIP